MSVSSAFTGMDEFFETRVGRQDDLQTKLSEAQQ
jgi:hypothetical protein